MKEKYYSIANTTLKTNIEFPELIKEKSLKESIKLLPGRVEINNEPFHQILNISNGKAWINFYKEPDFVIDFISLVRFQISNKTIIYDNYAHVNNETLRHLILDQVIPYFLSINDIVLHGSGIKEKNNGFVFIAESGTGKSTIASVLSKVTELISDDFILLDNQNNKINATPSYPSVRLWKEDVDTNKVIFKEKHPAQKFCSSKTGIHSMFLLDRDLSLDKNQTLISKAKEEQIIEKILSNLFIIDPSNKEKLSDIFVLLESIIKNTNIYSLSFSDIKEINPNVLLKRLKEV